MHRKMIIPQIFGMVLMTLIVSYPAWAGSLDEPGEFAQSYGHVYLDDTRNIFAAPGNWETKEWVTALGVISIAGILYDSDQAIQDFFQNRRNHATDSFADFIKPLGDPLVVVPSLGLFYWYGKRTNDPKAMKAASLSLESGAIAGGLTYGLKFLSHRSRPYQSDSAKEWGGASLSYTDSRMSFTSTHSAIAFSVATVFSSVYDDRPWLPYLSYGAASLVALSRINDNEHWSSDVFCGSVLGYFTAKSILSNHQSEENTGLTISPLVSGDGMGVVLEYRF